MCCLSTLMYNLQRFALLRLWPFLYYGANYGANERLNGVSQLPGIRGVVQGEASFGIRSVGINTIAQKLVPNLSLPRETMYSPYPP